MQMRSAFGSGIRGELKDIYDDAKERGAVVTTLIPEAQPHSREDMLAKAEATNKKVLAAFQKHEYRSGLSTNTVERDQGVASAFAVYLMGHQLLPISLRDFQIEDVLHYMKSIPETGRKTPQISLKRFITFLRDTGRLDWEKSEIILVRLKAV